MPPRPPAALPFCKYLGAALLLLLAAALPAQAGEIADAAGRRVLVPDHVMRVMPAERNAEVLTLVLAPKKLVGLEWLPGRASLPRTGHPVVLGWRLRTVPESMAETARQLHPDLIIDAGIVNAERAAYADQVQQLTGIPYILVDDGIVRIPTVLRSIGALLDVADRAEDLATFAEHAMVSLRGRLLIRPANARPRVYFAQGPDGLTTALPGSPAGEAIDEAGAINVAGVAGHGGNISVTREQLLSWNPDIIIAERGSAYQALLHSPGWRQLPAVRARKVYLQPTNPFGWIDDPSGVNRLIGLYWLTALLYPDALQEDLRTTTCDFYDRFYRIRLGVRQMEAMLRAAGAPPPQTGTGLGAATGEPLLGLGSAPITPMPLGNQPTSSTNTSALAQGSMMNTGKSGTCSLPQGLSPQPIGNITGAPIPPGPGEPGRRPRPAPPNPGQG